MIYCIQVSFCHSGIILPSRYHFAIPVLSWHPRIILPSRYYLAIQVLFWHPGIILPSTYHFSLQVLSWHSCIILALRYHFALQVSFWHSGIILPFRYNFGNRNANCSTVPCITIIKYDSWVLVYRVWGILPCSVKSRQAISRSCTVQLVGLSKKG